MDAPAPNKLAPFVAVTFVYFLVGFLTTVNGQCQAPLQTAFLQHAGNWKNTLVTLIPFFFFLAYLVNSPAGARWIARFGYKKTMLRGLVIMAAGLAVFFLSAWMTAGGDSGVVSWAGAQIPHGYFVFLLGSFLMGTSAAVLQVVVNPYVTYYDLKGTQPVQRLNIVCAVNSFGTTIAPFFVTGILFGGVAMENVRAGQLQIPFLLLFALVVLTALATRSMDVPDVKDTHAQAGRPLERSIWSFRHLALGIAAIFFYVGAEVSIGVNVNLHAVALAREGRPLSFLGSPGLEIGGMDLGIPALLATLYWGGLMAGRLVSGSLSRISARTQLTVATIAAGLLTMAAIAADNLWVLVSVGLFHSVMWGCIFALATRGLHRYTAKASGAFMMGVFGGAVFPLAQGAMADYFGDWKWSWTLVVVCELVMLAYARFGSRVRPSDVDAVAEEREASSETSAEVEGS